MVVASGGCPAGLLISNTTLVDSTLPTRCDAPGSGPQPWGSLRTPGSWRPPTRPATSHGRSQCRPSPLRGPRHGRPPWRTTQPCLERLRAGVAGPAGSARRTTEGLARATKNPGEVASRAEDCLAGRRAGAMGCLPVGHTGPVHVATVGLARMQPADTASRRRDVLQPVKKSYRLPIRQVASARRSSMSQVRCVWL